MGWRQLWRPAARSNPPPSLAPSSPHRLGVRVWAFLCSSVSLLFVTVSDLMLCRINHAEALWVVCTVYIHMSVCVCRNMCERTCRKHVSLCEVMLNISLIFTLTWGKESHCGWNGFQHFQRILVFPLNHSPPLVTIMKVPLLFAQYKLDFVMDDWE